MRVAKRSLRPGAVALLVLTALMAGPVVEYADAGPGNAKSPLPPRLPTLLGSASVVVLGDVGAVTEHDAGRLLRARLRVSRALTGSVEGAVISVIEDRRFPSVPSVLRSGRRVIAFLFPAEENTQLRRALPPGPYYRLAGDRWGQIELPDAESERSVLSALEGWMSIASSEPRPEQVPEPTTRRVVFSELAARHERLVQDGAAGLGEMPGLAGTLTATEREILSGVLRRTDLPERTRIAVVEAIRDAGLRSVAPVLRDLPGAGPGLLRASALARTQLGDELGRAEIDRVLGQEDPATRAAAVPALLRSEAGGLAAVSALAVEDPAREVRLAAVEALGESGIPEALPTLGRTFVDADVEIRRKSGRAIYNIGGRPAAELLAELTFTAPPDEQRRAVALMKALGIAADDPLFVRIRDRHPDAAVRDLVGQELETHHH